MAGAAVVIATRRGASPRAVARALCTTGLDRIPAAERAWLARIAAYRVQLASGGIVESASPDDRRLAEAERRAEAADACLWMSLPPLLGTLVMRLVRELAPRRCLELGTGFGVSTSYQAAALELSGAGDIVSLDLEGMTRIAGPGLAGIGLGDRVELRPGRIEETLPGALGMAAPIDFALLDADHTEAGTVGAFDALAPHLSPGAVIMVDDVNWTAEMRRAWQAVRAHPHVDASVRLRRIGILIMADHRGGA